MLLLKLFGVLDIYSAAVMLLVHFDIVEWRLIFTATAYLILKGYLFKGDIASMIDFGIGAYHIVMILLPISVITYICCGYLLVKGFQSMV